MLIPFIFRQIAELVKESPRHPINAEGRDYTITPDEWKGRRTRPPRAVERIVVHQTGIEFGVSKRQLAAAGGDRAKAHRMRFQATPYHYVLTLRGDLLRVHPIHRWTYHAGPANRTSIGVAFEGLFPRFERQRGDRHTTLTNPVLVSWRAFFAQIVSEHPDLRVVTHAQVTARRAADPGELIMQQIVNGAADVDHTWGRPTPGEWR